MLTWNVRGLNIPIKYSAIKEIITKRHISLVGLIETKLKKVTQPKIISIWENSDYSYIAANTTENNSGRVLLI